jgi:hypothetical protein
VFRWGIACRTTDLPTQRATVDLVPINRPARRLGFLAGRSDEAA